MSLFEDIRNKYKNTDKVLCVVLIYNLQNILCSFVTLNTRIKIINKTDHKYIVDFLFF